MDLENQIISVNREILEMIETKKGLETFINI